MTCDGQRDVPCSLSRDRYPAAASCQEAKCWPQVGRWSKKSHGQIVPSPLPWFARPKKAWFWWPSRNPYHAKTNQPRRCPEREQCTTTQVEETPRPGSARPRPTSWRQKDSGKTCQPRKMFRLPARGCQRSWVVPSPGAISKSMRGETSSGVIGG